MDIFPLFPQIYSEDGLDEAMYHQLFTVNILTFMEKYIGVHICLSCHVYNDTSGLKLTNNLLTSSM